FSDNRINVISRENKGLIASLNEAISLAEGRYIARMDADDIALPNRLKVQYDFMENNPAVGVVGSFAEVFGENVVNDIIKQPLSHESIGAKLFIDSPFIHPTVMFRSSILSDNEVYSKDFYRVEDYALWVKLYHHTKLANIDRVLLKYRIV